MHRPPPKTEADAVDAVTEWGTDLANAAEAYGLEAEAVVRNGTSVEVTTQQRSTPEATARRRFAHSRGDRVQTASGGRTVD